MLTKVQLTGEQFQLLREVILNRAPQLQSVMGDGCAVNIRVEQLRQIQELLGDELCETGLERSHEPNRRGLLLEHLIDAFTPYRRGGA